jgi:hypothetical protein
MNRIANPVVTHVLRSQMHALLSRSLLLITVTGRRTGRPTTLPVRYALQGDDLLIVSSADRTWWRNLEGGAPVMVHLHGALLHGHGELLPRDAAEPDRIAVRVSALRPLDGSSSGRT